MADGVADGRGVAEIAAGGRGRGLDARRIPKGVTVGVDVAKGVNEDVGVDGDVSVGVNGEVSVDEGVTTGDGVSKCMGFKNMTLR